MKSNQKSVFGGWLKQFLQELREVYSFIKGNKIIIRNLSVRLGLFVMGAVFFVNIYTQHVKAVFDEKNIQSLVEIFNNPELSDESIKLVKISGEF